MPPFHTWTAEHSGTSVNLHAVWGAGPEDVFAVGDNGTVLHRDPSMGWQQETTPAEDELRSVWGAEGVVYAAGGTDNAALWMRNNDAAWVVLSSPIASALLNRVGGSSSTDFLIASDSGTVARTTDGGSTWSLTMLSRPNWGSSLTGTWIEDATTAWIVTTDAATGGADESYSGTIWHTSDSGGSWQIVARVGAAETGTLASFSSVAGTTDGHVFVGANIPAFDAQTAATGSDEVRFVTDVHGAAGELFAVTREGAVVHSVDGGSTWYEERPADGRALNGVWSDSNGAAFAVGDNGMIWRRN